MQKKVVQLKKIFLLLVILLAGCVQQDFEYGLAKLNEINSRYNATIETYPKSAEHIGLMIKDLDSLKKLQLQNGQEPFDRLIRYHILNLEAEGLFIESQKHGFNDLAKTGFACKPRPLILESVALRNQSAQKGFEAASLLREFINGYPEDAKAAGLSNKSVLFLNASFYDIARIARGDSNLINHFCPKNVTLELYREEFRKRTNLSEENINNLTYDKAVVIWKKIREFE